MSGRHASHTSALKSAGELHAPTPQVACSRRFSTNAPGRFTHSVRCPSTAGGGSGLRGMTKTELEVSAGASDAADPRKARPQYHKPMRSGNSNAEEAEVFAKKRGEGRLPATLCVNLHVFCAEEHLAPFESR